MNPMVLWTACSPSRRLMMPDRLSSTSRQHLFANVSCRVAAFKIDFSTFRRFVSAAFVVCLLWFNNVMKATVKPLVISQFLW